MIDGQVVVTDPQSAHLSGAGWHVPIMIETNSLDIGFGFAPDKPFKKLRNCGGFWVIQFGYGPIFITLCSSMDVVRKGAGNPLIPGVLAGIGA